MIKTAEPLYCKQVGQMADRFLVTGYKYVVHEKQDTHFDVNCEALEFVPGTPATPAKAAVEGVEGHPGDESLGVEPKEGVVAQEAEDEIPGLPDQVVMKGGWSVILRLPELEAHPFEITIGDEEGTKRILEQIMVRIGEFPEGEAEAVIAGSERG
jgi:hypothetical protein